MSAAVELQVVSDSARGVVRLEDIHVSPEAEIREIRSRWLNTVVTKGNTYTLITGVYIATDGKVTFALSAGTDYVPYQS